MRPIDKDRLLGWLMDAALAAPPTESADSTAHAMDRAAYETLRRVMNYVEGMPEIRQKPERSKSYLELLREELPEATDKEIEETVLRDCPAQHFRMSNGFCPPEAATRKDLTPKRRCRLCWERPAEVQP